MWNRFREWTTALDLCGTGSESGQQHWTRMQKIHGSNLAKVTSGGKQDIQHQLQPCIRTLLLAPDNATPASLQIRAISVYYKSTKMEFMLASYCSTQHIDRYKISSWAIAKIKNLP